MATYEYKCNWQSDLGPKDGFLKLNIGSRIEKSRIKQSFKVFVNNCTKENQEDGRDDWCHKHICSLQSVSSHRVNVEKFMNVQQSCKNKNEQNGPVDRIFVSFSMK